MNLEQTYKTMPLFLLVLYGLVIIVYFLVLVQILKLFKEAYPKSYEVIKVKFISFLVFYEMFIMFRAIDYYWRQFGKWKAINRYAEISYYIFELVFITLLSYVGYKNMKNENNQEVKDSGKGIPQNVRNSFMAFSDNSMIKDIEEDDDFNNNFDPSNFGNINPSQRLTNESRKSNHMHHELNFSHNERVRSQSK